MGIVDFGSINAFFLIGRFRGFFRKAARIGMFLPLVSSFNFHIIKSMLLSRISSELDS